MNEFLGGVANHSDSGEVSDTFDLSGEDLKRATLGALD
jgi:hypothetical protein